MQSEVFIKIKSPEKPAVVSAEDVKAAIDRFYRKKMKDMWTAEKMILELKKRGKRITRQRLLIIEVIAMKKSGDFKEIYYEIYRRNPNIGQATVYRMLLTLEDIGAIRRVQGYVVNECDEKTVV